LLLALTALYLRGAASRSAVEPPAAPPESPASPAQDVLTAVVPPLATEPTAAFEPPDVASTRTEQVPEPDPEPGPHGRVVEVETGVPLEGLTVRLGNLARVLEETVTDEDGAFSFSRPDRSRRTVEVVAEGWAFAPARARLTEDQTTGVVELSFEGRRVLAAPVRGRLVDERTGETVPDYVIEIFGPQVAEATEGDRADYGFSTPMSVRVPPYLRFDSVLTDADGRFASSVSFEAGTLSIDTRDHPRLEVRPDFHWEYRHEFHDAQHPPERDVPIPVGPTYRFDLALPEGLEVDDFVVVVPVLLATSREMHRMRLDVPEMASFPFFQGLTLPEPEALLREGEPLWARFREPIFSPVETDANGFFPLRVRSRDGLWAGEALVDSVVGVYPELVPVTLSPRGAIEGTVVDGDRHPVPTAWIRVEPVSGAPRPPEEAGADRDGRFAFRWLPAGEYEVSVETDRYRPWSQRVTVAGGSVVPLDVNLVADLPLGSISGELRSRSGTQRRLWTGLLLQSLANPTFTSERMAKYRERDGELVAPFAFEDLPVGEYELQLVLMDNQPWDARTKVLTAPAEGVVFTCLDDVPTYELVVRCVDAETGEPLEGAQSRVRVTGPGQGYWLREDMDSVMRQTQGLREQRYGLVPEDARLEWIVGAPGHGLARGDESAMRIESGVGVVETRLTPGFGQFFLVTTHDRGLRPIAGVELLADGASIGRTDERGVVFLEGEEEPARIEFRYPGWHESWRSSSPEAMKRQGLGWNLEVPVYLSPDD